MVELVTWLNAVWMSGTSLVPLGEPTKFVCWTGTGSVNLGGGRDSQSTVAAVAQRAVGVVRFVENWKIKYFAAMAFSEFVTGHWLKIRFVTPLLTVPTLAVAWNAS